MAKLKSLETYEFAELGMNGTIPEEGLADLVQKISSSKLTIIWGVPAEYAPRLKNRLASEKELCAYSFKYERKTITAVRKEGYCQDA